MKNREIKCGVIIKLDQIVVIDERDWFVYLYRRRGIKWLNKKRVRSELFNGFN